MNISMFWFHDRNIAQKYLYWSITLNCEQFNGVERNGKCIKLLISNF
jgi:hypothetical protein